MAVRVLFRMPSIQPCRLRVLTEWKTVRLATSVAGSLIILIKSFEKTGAALTCSPDGETKVTHSKRMRESFAIFNCLYKHRGCASRFQRGGFFILFLLERFWNELNRALCLLFFWPEKQHALRPFLRVGHSQASPVVVLAVRINLLK